MGKLVSRGVISQSKNEDNAAPVYSFYCVCGEFVLVLDTPLASLAQRPLDNAFALENDGAEKVHYKLNVMPETREDGSECGGVLIRRAAGYEFQRRLCCPRCRLLVAYQTDPAMPGTTTSKALCTFVLEHAVSEKQVS